MSNDAGVRNLVKRAKNRDPESFGMLYDEYVDQIFRYVYYKVGNVTESQDLTGQTFLKAFENIDSYEMRDVAFSSWLYQIAHNLIVDFFRRESKQERVPFEDNPPTVSPHGNPVEAVISDMESERLYKAMRKLTHNQREVLILKFIDNLSNAHIAEIMGVSVGAVKSTQKRGLLSLNRILGNSSEINS
ncbi:MAG: RNA polymerase subunit sigma-70 [Candidatus Anoxymicrobium japonicum]|uniref:RNA polymerase subunit sigma-70 n=1 Tax=Candidatus Anoxymicrobium japonicum TaxID=2013648 RepID=A0A2N3G5V1_9ACTN|nr:MAG: RNA polymerase subunit sigma-70 [Candidatus Anoxymicrobium japonicum]